ncbi:MAG: hypothetical protein DRQ46_00415 [Gammaproteobacteria bacterium]|nr:MAG: hypothetical protein DRQ46_00415 [Gammaproteobacteria bacterium]
MSEQTIQSRIMKDINSRKGCHAFKIVSASKAGCPDILACINGHFIGMEIKKPGEIPTPQQAHRLTQIRSSGGVSVWFDSFDSYFDWIERFIPRALFEVDDSFRELAPPTAKIIEELMI